MKELLSKYIDKEKERILKMADSIFDSPELGLEEFQAVDKIQAYKYAQICHGAVLLKSQSVLLHL